MIVSDGIDEPILFFWDFLCSDGWFHYWCYYYMDLYFGLGFIFGIFVILAERVGMRMRIGV